MKEFKFWAIPYSLKQIMLITMPVGIIMVLFIFFTDISYITSHFIYFFLAIFIWTLFLFTFFVRRVKITFNHDNEISIFYYGKEIYKTKAEGLEYLIGDDIIDSKCQSDIKLSFFDKKFTFTTGHTRGLQASKIDEPIALLRYMTATFELKKEPFRDRLFLDKEYIYRNPSFNPSLIKEQKSYIKNEK
ncbi:hypothetical protein [Dysgonomonas sp. BGC7]|uniref:hypothetical protein n=1 Tax=Dysgonomonas sp. BGC7 TaxID=1658008 RepID=UPI00068355ED|nr:hypothetical protein [Dysgonomonas sp. BGC7]MBD8390306.1 hypothetical protein [Dysgonomonas sp. BGC7]